jgi:hypothetical protein
MPVAMGTEFIAKGMFGKEENVYPQHPQGQSLQRLIE